MRELWLWLREDLPPVSKARLLERSAQCCDGVLVGEGDVALARKAGVRAVASPKGGDIDLLPAERGDEIARSLGARRRVAVCATVRDAEDISAVAAVARQGAEYVIVWCPDWKVIPLENLVSEARGRCKLLARVASPQEVRLALETLEIGADGVALETAEPDALEEGLEALRLVRTRIEEKERGPLIELLPAKVVRTRPVGMGARVCVDTCDLMGSGEGMLVGSQSGGLFLVQAEVEESPLAPPRPFRVNAGPVSSYILTRGGTMYLSEVRAGSEVLIVDRRGRARGTVVGRAKIEWRPLVLIEARVRGRVVKTLLQNAETIRLVTSDGSRPVTELKPGDEVLVRLQERGRHFGKPVKETIIEW